MKFNLMEYASHKTLMDFFSSSKSTKNFYVTASYGMKEVTNKGSLTVSEPVTNAPQASKPPKTIVIN